MRQNITEVSVLKVRIRFSKTGALVYIGHLDVMRYFQKLFRRSKIPVAYSEGFSPHQILSFTPPLPLGLESFGEYADVEITGSVKSEDALKKLRANSVPEIEILSFRELPDKCDNAMASVNAAGYRIYFDGRIEGDAIKKAVSDFADRDNVMVVKKTKKNETVTDLKPLVYELEYDESKSALKMLISSGSRNNIKPELVLSELIPDTDPKLFRTERTDQYTMYDGRFTSLDEIGKDIT